MLKLQSLEAYDSKSHQRSNNHIVAKVTEEDEQDEMGALTI